MSETTTYTRGLLDTSVIIDVDNIDDNLLPDVSAIATVTLAELAAGVHQAKDASSRAKRLLRLQRIELQLDALPFDNAASQLYGVAVGAVIAVGRNPRPRKLDLMIAATAAANGLPLYTRNPKDFEGLNEVVDVKAV